VDSEQFSRVFRVTEFLAEGCSQGLENLGVKETPMFVAKPLGPDGDTSSDSSLFLSFLRCDNVT
jgi:hypothetical protein